MMIRSKLSISLLAFLLVAGTSFAATVTVGPTGQFATVNAALGSIDYNDGSADVVIMEAGFVNNEQVVLKGDAGADSTTFPRATGMSQAGFQNAISSHSDPLTITSADPNNPGVLTMTSGTPAFYGLDYTDPGDSFVAALPVVSKDVTLDGVEIRYGNTADYCLNGQGSEWTFQDCLFSYASSSGGQDDFFNMQNITRDLSVVDPLIGLDNTYVFDGCILDLTNQSNNDFLAHQFIFMGGLQAHAPAPSANVQSCIFNNTIFRNSRGFIGEMRGHGTAGPDQLVLGWLDVSITNCFSENMTVGDRAMFNPEGYTEGWNFLNNVFSVGHAVMFLDNRGGRGPGEVNIANNLLVGPGNAALSHAILRLNFSGATGGNDVKVVNNTFFNYGANQAALCTGTAPGALLVANNIFCASTAVAQGIAVDGQNFATLTATLTNNGFFNNTTNVNGVPSGGETGSITTDPAFAADSSGGFPAVGGPTDLNIPASPLSGDDFTDRVGRQNFIPTGAAYINGGNGASYNSAAFGSVDVDGLNARIGGAGIDIGAQESDGTSLVASWDKY